MSENTWQQKTVVFIRYIVAFPLAIVASITSGDIITLLNIVLRSSEGVGFMPGAGVMDYLWQAQFDIITFITAAIINGVVSGFVFLWTAILIAEHRQRLIARICVGLVSLLVVVMFVFIFIIGYDNVSDLVYWKQGSYISLLITVIWIMKKEEFK